MRGFGPISWARIIAPLKSISRSSSRKPNPFASGSNLPGSNLPGSNLPGSDLPGSDLGGCVGSGNRPK
ncbi:pentapeptide repeat-containing protein [Neorhodopirellula lusitana]|uniref:pentapeptide repeat-containing protein n=1 Tax=Neorhodopirellula lusitana TaxID=445327 RepID=UPI003D28DCA5